MKLKALLSALLLMPLAAFGQFGQNITNAQFYGTGNILESGATLTLANGSTVNFQIGSYGSGQLVYLSNGSGTLAPLNLGAGMSIVGGALVAGSSTSANPTALVGTSAVNGVAVTYMTSDSAPALNLAIAPTWTGLHTFALTDTHTSTGGYGIAITPTLNQRNATFFSLIYGNETVTQAGTGNQYLEELAVGGTDKWVVDVNGVVKTGYWDGSPVLSAYGGTGQSTFAEGALLAASAANTWSALNPSSTAGYFLGSNGTGAVPSYFAPTAILDLIGSAAQGVILERGASAWQYITPGGTGTVLMSNGASADPSYQGPLSQLFTATGDMAYSTSGSTAAKLPIGLTGQFLEVVAGVPAWATFSALSNPMTTLNDVIYGGISGVPTRLQAGANSTFLGLNGSGVIGWYAVAGTSAANPTATVGTSAVNGSATTFMRSDAAPAINLTMAPTWTGLHTWSTAAGSMLINLSSGAGIAYLRYTNATSGDYWNVGMDENGDANGYDIACSVNSVGPNGDTIEIAPTTGIVTIYATAASTSTVTGALVLGGGLGLPGAVTSGNLNVINTASSGAANGTAQIQGMTTLNGATYTWGALPSGATTTGSALTLPAITDTVTGTNTATNFQAVYIGIPTWTDSGAGTVTNAATVWINGAPAHAGSLAITNAFALYVNAGAAQFGGTMQSIGEFGYVAGGGEGSTVSQITSKTTGVTLNNVCGEITLNNAALGGGASATFLVTDSAVHGVDWPGVWVYGNNSSTANAYEAHCTGVTAGGGSFYITVTNITGGSLSEAPIIGFAIVRASTN